jgi:hypothetical protein
MFQDPTIALRDASEMKAAAKIYGIDLSRLLGYSLPEFPDEDELKLHVFERFWSQLGPVDRMKQVVELGRGRQLPQSIV